jgi:hypothetical protein
MDNEGRSILDPGSNVEVPCGVCGEIMKVQQGVVGPTSWASAMAHHTREYDLHTCPHINAIWHQQALALLRVIEDTPSETLAEMLGKEYRKVVRLKEATKSSWKKF